MTLLALLGLLGVGLVLLGYVLLVAGKFSSNSPRYQLLNIIGTLSILLSLAEQWNLAAFVTNIAWLTVGLIALVRLKIKGATSWN